MTAPRRHDDRSRDPGFGALTAAFTELERRADAVSETAQSAERTAHRGSPARGVEHPRPVTDLWWRRFAPLAAAAAVVLAVGGVGTWWAISPPSTTANTATTNGIGPSTPTAATAACRNLDIPSKVSASLNAADGRVDTEPVPGATFYGTCGTTSYAVVRYQLLSGVTPAENPSLQGAGAYPELFVNHGSGWVLTAHATQPQGCTDSTALPAALRTLWKNCAPNTAPTACEQFSATHHLIRPNTVTVHNDGSATITGNVVTRHCGGVNNVQYNVSSTLSAPVNLRAGAPVMVLHNGVTPAPLDVRQLAAYQAANHGAVNLVITGRLSGTGFDATELTQPYHP